MIKYIPVSKSGTIWVLYVPDYDQFVEIIQTESGVYVYDYYETMDLSEELREEVLKDFEELIQLHYPHNTKFNYIMIINSYLRSEKIKKILNR